MNCTIEDMQRWLRELTGDPALHILDNKVRLDADGVPIDVTVTPLPPRHLGLVRFQDARVQFSYPPSHAAQARRWLIEFDRHTQRGGG